MISNDSKANHPGRCCLVAITYTIRHEFNHHDLFFFQQHITLSVSECKTISEWQNKNPTTVVPLATEPTRTDNSAIIWSSSTEQQPSFITAFRSYSTSSLKRTWNKRKFRRARKEPYSWACWAARPRWRRACSWTGSRRFRWAAASASEPPAASARSLQVQHEAELVTS